MITLSRDNYIKNGNISGLLSYVKALEAKNGLGHRYDVKFPRLRKLIGENHVVALDSLVSALDMYYWPTETCEESEEEGDDASAVGCENTFNANERILNALSSSLKSALGRNDLDATFFYCIKILDWGQVFKGSVRWVVSRYENFPFLFITQ